MDWNLESHYTPHLAPGAAQVDAIVSVSLSGDGNGTSIGGSQERALGFIADRSGSMNGLGRMEAVRGALGAAIEGSRRIPRFSSLRSTSRQRSCLHRPRRRR